VDRITQLSDRIQLFQVRVAGGVDEPWRSGLLAILMQLQLALEAFLALRSATASELVATAERLANAQLASVRRDVLPTRPPDVSEAAIFDRKADLIRLLDLQPPGGELLDYALNLAREAIRDGDDLTLYCLASGPLDFYYRARQLDFAEVRERILGLRGGSSVARLLEEFTGPEGIAALVLEMKRALADSGTREEVQQALLRPNLDLGDDADELTPEERQEIEAIEQEFRQVATIVGDLGATGASAETDPGKRSSRPGKPARGAASRIRPPGERRRRADAEANPPERAREGPEFG
jgi:hypothetical protein